MLLLRWNPIHSVIVSLVVLAFSTEIQAQDELTAVPNRPTVSNPAQPVQPGVLETEWGVDAAESHQDINGLLKFGVAKNLELRMTNNPITADSGTHGVGHTGLGFHYLLIQVSGHRLSI